MCTLLRVTISDYFRLYSSITILFIRVSEIIIVHLEGYNERTQSSFFSIPRRTMRMDAPLSKQTPANGVAWRGTVPLCRVPLIHVANTKIILKSILITCVAAHARRPATKAVRLALDIWSGGGQHGRLEQFASPLPVRCPSSTPPRPGDIFITGSKLNNRSRHRHCTLIRLVGFAGRRCTLRRQRRRPRRHSFSLIVSFAN